MFFWKTFLGDLQARNHQATAFQENLEFCFLLQRGPIVKSCFENVWNFWQISGTDANLPPSSATWAHMCPGPGKKIRSAVIFFKSLFLAHMNCGVLTTADPSCWSDRSWVGWVDGLMDSCGFYPHLRLEARHPLSNPRSTRLNQTKSESLRSIAAVGFIKFCLWFYLSNPMRSSIEQIFVSDYICQIRCVEVYRTNRDMVTLSMTKSKSVHSIKMTRIPMVPKFYQVVK